MAGRRLLHDINGRTVALAEEHGFKDGEAWFKAQIAEGRKLKDIAAELGCSVGYLYVWRDQEGYAEKRQAMWEEGRRLAAESYADMGIERLEKAAEDRDISGGQARAVDALAKYRQWQAESADPNRFGQNKRQGANVVVNLPGLHVGALRSVEWPAVEEGRVLDAEVIEDGEADAVELLQGA